MHERERSCHTYSLNVPKRLLSMQTWVAAYARAFSCVFVRVYNLTMRPPYVLVGWRNGWMDGWLTGWAEWMDGLWPIVVWTQNFAGIADKFTDAGGICSSPQGHRRNSSY